MREILDNGDWVSPFFPGDRKERIPVPIVSKGVGNSPRLLLFDIGNVLVRYSEERATQNFERLAPGRGAAMVRLIWHDRLGDAFESGRLTARGFRDAACRRLECSISLAAFREAFVNVFTPVRENLRLLKRLSKRHSTALLSNTNPWHWSYLHGRYPVLGQTRWRFVSHRLKLRKPQKALFRHVVRVTGFPFERQVYIDDRPEFIAAARRLGMTGVVFDGSGGLEEPLSTLGLI